MPVSLRKTPTPTPATTRPASRVWILDEWTLTQGSDDHDIHGVYADYGVAFDAFAALVTDIDPGFDLDRMRRSPSGALGAGTRNRLVHLTPHEVQ